MGARPSRFLGFWGLCALALVGLTVMFAVSLTTDDSEPVSAAIGGQLSIKWGDTDCSNTIDVWDVLVIEQHVLGIPLGRNECRFAPTDPTDMLVPGASIKALQPNALTYGGFWADFTCDREVTPFDALSVLRWISGTWSDDQASHEVPIGCPDFDIGADVTEIPIYPLPQPPGPIPEIAADTSVAGNTPTGLGPTDDCVAVQVNSLFEVDVVIKGIPVSYADNHGDFTVGGISSFSLDLWYDPAIIQVVGEDPRFILQALGTAHLVDNSNALPDTDGHYHVAVYDSSTFYEYGDGVLVRMMFQAKAAGTATIFLGNPNVLADKPGPADALNTIYEVITVKTAEVHVASPCPTPTPTPSPSPTPSPGPTGDNACLNVDPAVAIPDDDNMGVNITRHFDAATLITAMNVCVNIAHQWAGNLVVTLTHQETGTTRTLIERLGNHVGSCSGGGNGVYVLLTDDTDVANLSMEDACTNQTSIIGTFFPDQPFVNGAGTFDGEQIAGAWTLNVRDMSQGGLGEVRGFRIDFNP